MINTKMRLRISILFLFSLALINTELNAEEILIWQDCVREAAANHPDLISAQENIIQSQADKDIEKSALFPQADVSAGASTAKTAARAQTDTYTYGASASQLIFDGLKTANDIKAASENIKASQESYKFASSDVRLRLRTAFVNMLRAQELLVVAEEIFEIRRGNFELITLRYESGLEHKGAFLAAEANLSGAQFEISQAKRDFEVALRQLTKEMGRVNLEPVRVKADFRILFEKEKPDLRLLADKNPSLLQAAFQKNAAQFGIKSAYAEYFPEISGSFSADKTGSRWPARGDQWSAGISLSLPISEGGLRNAQVSRAKSVYRQLEASERSTKDAVIVGLEQVWQALQSSIEAVAVQAKILSASEERSRIAEAQYSTGFLSYDNWIIIQDNLVNAKKNYLETRIASLLAEANWIQAKGETLEYVEEKI